MVDNEFCYVVELFVVDDCDYIDCLYISCIPSVTSMNFSHTSIIFWLFGGILSARNTCAGSMPSLMSILPVPRSSHSADKSGKAFRIFSNLSLPIDLELLINPLDRPHISSAALFFIPLNFRYSFNLSAVFIMLSFVNIRK